MEGAEGSAAAVLLVLLLLLLARVLEPARGHM